MKWAESETLKLVGLYKEHECIWNINSIDYRSKQKRLEAYQNIVNKMNKEDFRVDDLKQKIKNLRCTYNQERIKIIKAQNFGRIYVPNMKWFKLMDSFMKNIIKISINSQHIVRRNNTPEEYKEYTEGMVVSLNPDAVITEENLSSVSSSSFNIPEHVLVKEEPQDFSEETVVDDPLLSEFTESKLAISSSVSLASTSRGLKRERTPEKDYYKPMQQDKKYTYHQHNSNEVLFATYIASSLEQIKNRKLKLQTKHKILTLLMTAELEDLDN